MRQFLNIHLLSLIGCYLLAAIGTENVREPSSLYAPSHDVSLPPALHRALFPLFRQRPRLKVDIAMALVAYTGFLICIVYQLGGFITGVSHPHGFTRPFLLSRCGGRDRRHPIQSDAPLQTVNHCRRKTFLRPAIALLFCDGACAFLQRHLSPDLPVLIIN